MDVKGFRSMASNGISIQRFGGGMCAKEVLLGGHTINKTNSISAR